MEADETLIAMVNGSTLLHASRQVYGSGSDFGYLLKPNTRMKAGGELLSEDFLKAPRPKK